MDNPQAGGHPHDHHYREDPPGVGLHSGTEGEDHHEKKSVLKKVKDKAKKIKETITKHGHGHEHGQEFDEEDDDEDEEMGEDTAVKGGQICESTVIKSRTIPVEELHAGQSGPTLERTTAMKENAFDSKDRVDASFPSQDTGKEDRSRQYGDNMGRPTAMEDHPYAPDYNTPQAFSSHPTARHGDQVKDGINLGESMALEDDPHAPKDRPEPPNYQSKVADPTGEGGEEVGITPIISSFDKMSVQNKPATVTGSHDQFSPEQLPTENQGEKPSDKTYLGKISTAAISAKNTVASKLGYGGEDKGEEMHGGDDQKPGSSITEYGKKIASTVTETLSPVYGKVAGAGSAVMSKVQGTGSEGAKEDDKGSEPEAGRVPDKGVSVKGYLAEKLKPGEEDRALSEVISDALHKRKDDPENEVMSEPTGKVTESEEVARRLGTGNKPAGEGSDSGDVKFDSSSNVSSGSGMVDRIRGAVSSWFGKGGDSDSQTPSEPIGGVLEGSGNGEESRGN